MASDDKHNVSARITDKALRAFETGIGISFHACQPGQVLTVKTCQLRVTKLGSSDDHLTLFIEDFGRREGQDLTLNPAAPNLLQDPTIQNLARAVCNPSNLVSLLDDDELAARPHHHLTSQVPNAHQYLSARQGGQPDKEISVDGSLNLTAPVHAQPDPLNGHDMRSRPEKQGLGTASQARNLLHLLSAQQGPQVDRPVDCEVDEQSGRENLPQRRSQTGCELPSRRFHKIQSGQQAILSCGGSWQYPLPNVQENINLLPSDLLEEFRKRSYRGFLKVKDGRNETTKSETDGGAHNRYRQMTMRTARNHLPTHDRRPSTPSDRSDDPTEWSQSCPPSSPPAGIHEADAVHDNEFRPVDSSDPLTKSDAGSSPCQSLPRSNQPLSHDAANNSDGSSDSGMDESVPFVVGDKQPRNGRDFDQTRPSRTQAVPVDRGMIVASNLTNGGPRSPDSAPARSIADRALEKARSSRLQRDVPSFRPLQSHLEQSDAPKTDGNTASNEAPPRAVTVQPKIPESNEGFQQANALVASTQAHAEVGHGQRSKPLDLGFDDQTSVVEDPAVTLHRERKGFLRDKGTHQQAEEASEDVPMNGSMITKMSLQGSSSVSKPAAHLSHPTQHAWSSLAGALDGPASRPNSREARALAELATPPHKANDLGMMNKYQSSHGQLDEPLEPPAKRRRIDGASVQPDTGSSRSMSAPNDDRSSQKPSPSLTVGADPFAIFVSTYPTYEEGRRHFQAMCKEIQQHGKALHRSLWDDYVIRNANEYEEACGMSYKDFYDEHVDEPIYTKRILNPARLQLVLEHSLKEKSVRKPIADDNKLGKVDARKPDQSKDLESEQRRRHKKSPTSADHLGLPESERSMEVEEDAVPSQANPLRSERRRTLPWQAVSPRPNGKQFINKCILYNSSSRTRGNSSLDKTDKEPLSDQFATTDLDRRRFELISDIQGSRQRPLQREHNRQHSVPQIGQRTDDKRRDGGSELRSDRHDINQPLLESVRKFGSSRIKQSACSTSRRPFADRGSLMEQRATRQSAGQQDDRRGSLRRGSTAQWIASSKIQDTKSATTEANAGITSLSFHE